MNARVVGQFGVERCRQSVALPHQHGVIALPGENFNTGSDLGDFRRADENHFDGASSGFDGPFCG